MPGPDVRTLRVDLTTVSTARDLHAALAGALGFPSHYGRNWDAFEECIRDEWPLPNRLILRGLGQVNRLLPREADLLMRCIADYNREVEPGCATEVIEE